MAYHISSIREYNLNGKLNVDLNSLDSVFYSSVDHGLCRNFGMSSKLPWVGGNDPAYRMIEQDESVIIKVDIKNEGDFPMNTRYCQSIDGVYNNGSSALYADGSQDLLNTPAFAAIVGPTSVTYRYVDEQGNEIAPSETFASRDNVNVAYSMKALRDYIGRDQMTLDDLTYVSYFTGYSMTANSKEIAGYTALETSQNRELRLDASKNIFTFVYKKNVESATEAPVDGNSTPSSVVETPNTGSGNESIPFARLGVVGVAAFGVIYFTSRKR